MSFLLLHFGHFNAPFSYSVTVRISEKFFLQAKQMNSY